MTTVNLATIAESIADIDLSAHSIRSKRPDNIPVNGLTECPYFAPRPDNFITEIQLTRESFGAGGSEKMNLLYTMNWQYFHAPVGTLSFQEYGELLANLAYIIEQIADNDAPDGAIDIKIQDIPGMAILADAAGNSYHGVNISLRVTEFING